MAIYSAFVQNELFTQDIKWNKIMDRRPPLLLDILWVPKDLECEIKFVWSKTVSLI